MSTIYMHRLDLQSCAHIWLLYIARNLCHCCWWPERWRVEKVCQKRNKKNLVRPWILSYPRQAHRHFLTFGAPTSGNFIPISSGVISSLCDIRAFTRMAPDARCLENPQP